MTGRAAFAHSCGAFVPVPLAHLAGAIIGSVCVFPLGATGGGAARLPSVAGRLRHSPITLIKTRFARRPSNSP
jgi:hypothetical protein